MNAAIISMLCLAQQWSQWRGPQGTGVAPEANPPLEWSESENLRWKVSLPGKGHSTPVIHGERVFVTAAMAIGDALPPLAELDPGAHDNDPVTHARRFLLTALARKDGEVLWQRTLAETLPHAAVHSTGSYASASPVTDGHAVFAFFGSYGLFAIDVDGAPLWEVDLGKMRVKHDHGEGSSPALHGETLVVNWDHEGESFVAAFDKQTGEERWRKPRPSVTSWSTPLVVVHDDKPQVIVSGSGRVSSYALDDGEPLWECGGLSRNVVASPVAGDGMVYLASSYEKQVMLGIALEGAQGDISDKDNVVWVRRKSTPYVPSPLLYGDALYILHHYQGTLSRLIARSGEEPQRAQRLPGIRNVYASPVGAAGRVYITDLDGTTLVLSHEAQPRVLAQNHLDDSFSASAAMAGDELYLRGERFLYCIAEQ
ncbi:MAG: outer membrane protein assembly factor BamB [Chlamydiales bacterium]|jgi:outer membrane protein assembly factor BamB